MFFLWIVFFEIYRKNIVEKTLGDVRSAAEVRLAGRALGCSVSESWVGAIFGGELLGYL